MNNTEVKIFNHSNREIHVMHHTPEYSAWRSMKKRCLNENNRDYKYYGGRGIKICDAWISSFLQFFADIGKRPHEKMSLDRIDNEGDYCKENCRWATKTIQARNQRIRKDNKTSCSGVSFDNTRSKYTSRIRVDGKRIFLGYFTELKDAIKARNQAELKYWKSNKAV